MYGWWNIGNNVAGIVVNLLIIAFLAVGGIGIGFLVYAAKQLKKAAPATEKPSE